MTNYKDILDRPTNKAFNEITNNIIWSTFAKLILFGTTDNKYIKDCMNKYGRPIYKE